MFTSFWNIICLLIFQQSPANLPYSYGLLFLLFLFTVLFNIHFTVELGLLHAYPLDLNSIVLLVTFYMVSIFFTLKVLFILLKKPERFLKGTTAWFIIELLSSILKGSLLIYFHPLVESSFAQTVFIFCILYELLLKAFILKSSLDLSWIYGILGVICVGIVARIPVLFLIAL